MAEIIDEQPIERQQPKIREHIKGVKFHTLAPGITTHPLVRSGRPCIEGTGITVANIASLYKFHHMDAQEIADHLWLEVSVIQDALDYYADHDSTLMFASSFPALIMTSSQTRNLAQTRIRFYIDESLSPEIVAQLRSHGIDCIRGPLGADDPVHLELATASGRGRLCRRRRFPQAGRKGNSAHRHHQGFAA